MKLFCPYKGIFRRNYVNYIYKELFRKSIHLCTAFVPFFLSRFYVLTEVLLLFALLFYSISEVLRLRGICIPIISSITNIAARKRDDGKFVLGPVTLVVGILLSSLFFEKPFYSIGIFALAFGDGIASLCGKLFGKIHIPFSNGKTVEGSLSCFAAIFCSTFLVSKNVFASLVIAILGMLIEAIPLKDFDNLVIPVILSFCSQFVL